MAEPQKDMQKEEKETVESDFHKRLPLMVAAAIIVVIGGGIAGIAYYGVSSNQVYIDKATVSAPLSVLAPSASGTLNAEYVNVGDTVAPNTVVAEVGTELLKSVSGGLVVSALANVGANVAANTPVVTVVDPTQLRVVGQLDENKGLADVAVGDRAVFTVDAFGGKQFEGVVDEVSPTARSGDVVFSISDKRATQSFDVKVAYDVTKYPELKNGMSARIWVYKK
jgi:multidrug resistance efflux pump